MYWGRKKIDSLVHFMTASHLAQIDPVNATVNTIGMRDIFVSLHLRREYENFFINLKHPTNMIENTLEADWTSSVAVFSMTRNDIKFVCRSTLSDQNCYITGSGPLGREFAREVHVNECKLVSVAPVLLQCGQGEVKYFQAASMQFQNTWLPLMMSCA